MIAVGIIGGTGYTGVELLRLLSRHPKVNIRTLTSRSEKGRKVSDVFASLKGVCDIVFSDLNDTVMADIADNCDVVFFATPHGVAMTYTPLLLAHGVKVIDLGADFRLQSLSDFQQWYGMEHGCVDILKNAIYGLPEVNRQKIATAQVIGNPGCYPTTAILGLKPVIEHENQQGKALINGRIIIDAKSGVSGAGRQGKLELSYAEVSDNFKAYGVTGHRHYPEIKQGIDDILNATFSHSLRFVPHLVPMIRGMFSTIHVPLSQDGTQVNWQMQFENVYRHEHFIDVLPMGVFPETRSVKTANKLQIAVHQEQDFLTILVVQDNLVKGASGQAVQNMNIMFGLDERLGLDNMPIIP